MGGCSGYMCRYEDVKTGGCVAGIYMCRYEDVRQVYVQV